MITTQLSNKNSVFIIAEVGNNHEGNFKLAMKMLESAAQTGVDAVKFQSCIPEFFIAINKTENLNRIKKFQLSNDQLRFLAKRAEELKVIFFSTPLDINTAIFLNEIQPIFKISSGDNNFYPLIEIIAKFDKQTIISTGLCDLKCIKKLIKFWIASGGKEDKLALMHCVTSYPTPLEQANLLAIQTLKSNFPNITIGYSDHTIGTDAALLSVGIGAKIIEKHFTLDKNQSDFRDHKLSANPHEMINLVQKIRNAQLLMGDGIKKIQECEKQIESEIRRSIAAARHITKGKIIEEKDLTWLRPGTGMALGKEKNLIGKKLNVSLEMGQLIEEKFLIK